MNIFAYLADSALRCPSCTLDTYAWANKKIIVKTMRGTGYRPYYIRTFQDAASFVLDQGYCIDREGNPITPIHDYNYETYTRECCDMCGKDLDMAVQCCADQPEAQGLDCCECNDCWLQGLPATS